MSFHNPFKGHKKDHKSPNPVDDHAQHQAHETGLPEKSSSTTSNTTALPLNPSARLSSDGVDGDSTSSTHNLPSYTDASSQPHPQHPHHHPSTATTTSPQPSSPPRYRSQPPDPYDPTGPAYGYQYAESAQNFAHPSSVAKDIGKEMKYDDPRAADLGRRASEGGRQDLTEMMNYFLRQQQLGKKSVDNSNFAWNGV